MVDKILQGTLVLATILLVGHWIYAHILKGNNPPELMIGIAVLVIGTGISFMIKEKGGGRF